MNKNFILLDKNNNLQKNATVVVGFSVDGREYLVYSLDENEQNSQIFVSKLISNSEGKYFIDNLQSDEKGKLNNIVYNIVILIPTEVQKGLVFDSLIATYLDKFSVKLLSNIPNLEVQEYYSNCSVAITSKVLVSAAIKLYDENLNNKVESVVSEVPTWTAPTEVISPMSALIGVSEVSISASEAKVQDSGVTTNLNLQSVPAQETVIPVPVDNSAIISTENSSSVSVNTAGGDSQSEKLVVVSDPSLGIGVQQHNVGKLKKAGFANNKYIIIGTVCLLLAVAVVITAYFLIENMG